MSVPVPLDHLAARWGQRLVDKALEVLPQEPDSIDKVEDLIRDASSVFQRHGLTTGFLFLLSRTSAEERAAKTMAAEMVELICEFDPSLQRPVGTGAQPLMEFLASQVTVQLPRLLQIHRVVGDSLAFARLTATAMGAREQTTASSEDTDGMASL